MASLTSPVFFLIHLFSFPLALFSLCVSDLTLEEKVGQLILVHFHGGIANEESRSYIQEINVGGFIYYQWSNGLTDPQQVRQLSNGLQEVARNKHNAIPLFIAIDQEGGRVTRLKNGFSSYPSQGELGKTQNWELSENNAFKMGRELIAVGINLNLAPVVDVCPKEGYSFIGDRSFGSNPQHVALWGKMALEGYKKAEIIATLKHFPGHGDVEVDSHFALPVILKTREELDQRELYPFRQLAAHAEAIMTAHLFIPCLDNERSATFSKKIVHDLLRTEFDFKGIILTDSLAMQGALSQYETIKEAALKSIEAGHDIILLGGKQLLSSQEHLEIKFDDVKRVHRYLVQSIQEDKLSEDRVNASVERILALKQKYLTYKE